jgi:hypothetical protein
MVAIGVRNLALCIAGRSAGSAGRSPLRSQPAVDSSIGARCRRMGTKMRLACAGFAIILLGMNTASGGVLSENDVKRVEAIKPLFQSLMVDLVETTKRPDISAGDADCIKSAIKELMQISDELSSYEYLITIEKEMTDFGEGNPMKGIVKFAVEKSNTILTSERKRIAQLSDRCTNYPVSFGKTQQTLRVIDTTTTILNSIGDRL